SNGTMLSTSGNGSGGLGINGAGSEIDAANATISTTGGYDPSTMQHAYGVYNGPIGSYPTGGVARLTDTSVSTQGAQMYGVVTSTGGATTLTGTNVTTGGVGAVGVASIAGGVTNVSGGSVGTTGRDAHALFVTGAGSQASLSGTNALATQGNGAIGIYAALG